MSEHNISVRELKEQDIEQLTDYWLTADQVFLEGMGVDVSKMPSRDDFCQMLNDQLGQSLQEKKSYCIIWVVDGKAVGHSNINKIIFGEEAYMHLHMWRDGLRKKGIGSSLVRLTLPYYFENFKLKRLFCEPYALNPAPNRTMENLGFSFVKTHVTIPGWLNFEQQVNLWELSRENYLRLYDPH